MDQASSLAVEVADNAVEEDGQLGLPGIAGSYDVKLEIFEGPIDLLLHLIRANELDVTDVSISAVSEQYLSYLDLMREVNINVAGDYLVMAATLALIKSRMLLPPDPSEVDDEGLDPAAALLERLLEYKRYKEVAERLSERDQLNREVFVVQGPAPEAPPEAEREIEVGVYELLKAYKELLDRGFHTGAAHTFEREPITVHERMIAVMELLSAREGVEFFEIFEVGGVEATRELLVATFIAMLELTRIAAIRIFQNLDEEGTPDGPIRLRARENTDGHDWSERIAEIM
ncbi:MAG: segregation/condensation protein A [Deltaproteobacteria bacterium]|nr:segregation/condensation protein A [Deltaproteobacteria bacterium]